MHHPAEHPPETPAAIRSPFHVPAAFRAALLATVMGGIPHDTQQPSAPIPQPERADHPRNIVRLASHERDVHFQHLFGTTQTIVPGTSYGTWIREPSPGGVPEALVRITQEHGITIILEDLKLGYSHHFHVASAQIHTPAGTTHLPDPTVLPHIESRPDGLTFSATFLGQLVEGSVSQARFHAIVTELLKNGRATIPVRGTITINAFFTEREIACSGSVTLEEETLPTVTVSQRRVTE